MIETISNLIEIVGKVSGSQPVFRGALVLRKHFKSVSRIKSQIGSVRPY